MRLNGLRLLAGWPDRQMTLREFADEAVRYLRALRPLHPLFGGTMHLTGSSWKEFEPLAPDLSNVVTFVQRFGWDRGAPKFWNSGVQSDRTMSLSGTARTGFLLSLNTSGAKALPETLGLRLRCGGSVDGGGALVVEFPEAGAPEFQDIDFVKRLVQVTVDCWQPESVEVVDTGFRNALELKTQSRFEFVGWLNYLDCRDAEPLVPADVHREPFGPQGLLTVLQPEVPRADSEAALERALRMYQALAPGQHLTYRKNRKSAGAVA